MSGQPQAVPGIDPAHAHQVLPPGAGRADWLALRRTGIGGSDVSALVGLSRYRSAYGLWMDKTGRTPLDLARPSEEAHWGALLEPVVRDEFAREHGLTIRPAGMLRSARWPWMLANPDGLCSDGAGYEGKTCSTYVADEWDDGQVPDHAELQAQWCMAVTGLERWHVVGLIGGQRSRHRVVERDSALVEHLVQFSGQWWTRHVLGDVEPPVDGSAATTDMLAERYQRAAPDTAAEIGPDDAERLLSRLGAATATAEAAERDAAEVRNQLRALIGDREQLTDGTRCVATWRPIDRFAHARLTAEHPELAARYTRTETRGVLDLDALRAAHPEIAARYQVRQLRITSTEGGHHDER